jgi:L-ascorbate metabolism protein UlaG (beta-lactamase superfamily)
MYPISDHFDGKKFHNLAPVDVTPKGAMWKIMKEYARKHPNKAPKTTPGPFVCDKLKLLHPLQDDVQVTWIGHSTVLLQIEGVTLLTDPVWYGRVSPFALVGPKRFFEAPIALSDLPPVDAVLLSHDHYDHLDRKTMLHLIGLSIPVITLLGVGNRLTAWGAPAAQITELDWWQATMVKSIKVTALPAQHFSGRSLSDRFSTLWGSFAISGPTKKIYFGADSGYHPQFKEIGEKLGPFDLTMLDSGAYHELWADIHMGPENAILAHQDLRGRLLMPIHWGTFSLALHPWKEPIERVEKAAAAAGVSLLVPAPASSYRLSDGPNNSGWWRRLT